MPRLSHHVRVGLEGEARHRVQVTHERLEIPESMPRQLRAYLFAMCMHVCVRFDGDMAEAFCQWATLQGCSPTCQPVESIA